MKTGCLFAVVFAVAGLLIFPFLAPFLFRGANMVRVGQAAAPPIGIICGIAGYLFGLNRHKKRS